MFAQFASAPTSAPMLVWQADGQSLQVQAEVFGTDVQATVARMAGAKRMIQAPTNEEALALALKYQLVSDQTNLILVHVRAEDEKAVGLPTLEQIEQMQAAGWGGFGSVREYDVLCCPPSHSSMATPSVWRTRDRSQAAARVDALASGAMDDFEIPAFCRKQADSGRRQESRGGISNFIRAALGSTKPKTGKKVVTPSKPPIFQSAAKPRNVDPGPIATPIEILQTFEDIAVNQLAENRLVNTLQNLNIPDELATVLDDLTAQLGSGAKAWAVVIKWLGAALADQMVLSRHGERLLRKILKAVDGDEVDLAVQRVEKKFGSARAKWGGIQASTEPAQSAWNTIPSSAHPNRHALHRGD